MISFDFPVDLDLAENESRPGLERLHQMQRGLARGVQDRALQHLAVDRHLIRRIARKRRQQHLRETPSERPPSAPDRER